jgi:hypothetical protein
MTREERQIQAIKGATSDLKELNDKFDELPNYLEKSVRALIFQHHVLKDVDVIYKYLCDNYNVIQMTFREMIEVILGIARCENTDCREWNKSDDLEYNSIYGCKVCPTCLRDL